MTDADNVIARARQFLFVREVGANAGRWVEAIQRIGGTSKGQPWCACFVSFVLGIWFDGAPPLAYTAGCDAMLTEAKAKGMVVSRPKKGDLFFVMKSVNDAVHVGFVVECVGDAFTTIEGNSNSDGGREGFGVFERNGAQSRNVRGSYTFVRYLK